MATLQQTKLKNLTNIAIFDKSVTPKLAYPVDTPTGVELDLGIEEQLNETTSELGEIVIESSFISARRPVASMTFPGLTPTLVALRDGYKLQNVTGDWAIEKRIRVTNSNKAKAAVTSGQEGFGMAADQAESYAWLYDGLGNITPLSRIDTASFNAANANTFKQEANFGYQFADSLVGSDVVFSFPLPSQSILEVGETPLDDLEVNFTAVTRKLDLFRLEIPSASIDLAGSGNLPIGSGEVSMQIRITFDGSTCKPVRYKWLGQVRAC